MAVKVLASTAAITAGLRSISAHPLVLIVKTHMLNMPSPGTEKRVPARHSAVDTVIHIVGTAPFDITYQRKSGKLIYDGGVGEKHCRVEGTLEKGEHYFKNVKMKGSIAEVNHVLKGNDAFIDDTGVADGSSFRWHLAIHRNLEDNLYGVIDAQAGGSPFGRLNLHVYTEVAGNQRRAAGYELVDIDGSDGKTGVQVRATDFVYNPKLGILEKARIHGRWGEFEEDLQMTRVIDQSEFK